MFKTIKQFDMNPQCIITAVKKKSKNNINHDLKSPSKVNSALHNAMSNKTSIFGKSLTEIVKQVSHK